MSEVEGKRKEGSLRVDTAAVDLQKYINQICCNEERFRPNEYLNFCWLANRMRAAAFDIVSNIRIANKESRDNPDRELFQRMALQCTQKLFDLGQYAYEQGVLKSKQIKYYTSLVQTVKDLLNKWRKSDKEVSNRQ